MPTATSTISNSQLDEQQILALAELAKQLRDLAETVLATSEAASGNYWRSVSARKLFGLLWETKCSSVARLNSPDGKPVGRIDDAWMSVSMAQAYLESGPSDTQKEYMVDLAVESVRLLVGTIGEIVDYELSLLSEDDAVRMAEELRWDSPAVPLRRKIYSWEMTHIGSGNVVASGDMESEHLGGVLDQLRAEALDAKHSLHTQVQVSWVDVLGEDASYEVSLDKVGGADLFLREGLKQSELV